MDMNSLAHTTWECKYHIVFAPKYRRKIIYKKIKADVGRILSELCKRKGVEIIEAEACPDHVFGSFTALSRYPPFVWPYPSLVSSSARYAFPFALFVK